MQKSEDIRQNDGKSARNFSVRDSLSSPDFRLLNSMNMKF